MAAAWRAEYNHRRPHSSLGYWTPAEFAAAAPPAAGRVDTTGTLKTLVLKMGAGQPPPFAPGFSWEVGMAASFDGPNALVFSPPFWPMPAC